MNKKHVRTQDTMPEHLGHVPKGFAMSARLTTITGDIDPHNAVAIVRASVCRVTEYRRAPRADFKASCRLLFAREIKHPSAQVLQRSRVTHTHTHARQRSRRRVSALCGISIHMTVRNGAQRRRFSRIALLHRLPPRADRRNTRPTNDRAQTNHDRCK